MMKYDWPIGELFHHVVLDSVFCFGKNPYEEQFLLEVEREITTAIVEERLKVGGYRFRYCKTFGTKNVHYHDGFRVLGEGDFTEATRLDLVSCFGDSTLGAQLKADIYHPVFSRVVANKKKAMKLWPSLSFWAKLKDPSLGARQSVYWQEKAANTRLDDQATHPSSAEFCDDKYEG